MFTLNTRLRPATPSASARKLNFLPAPTALVVSQAKALGSEMGAVAPRAIQQVTKTIRHYQTTAETTITTTRIALMASVAKMGAAARAETAQGEQAPVVAAQVGAVVAEERAPVGACSVRACSATKAVGPVAKVAL